MSYPNRSRQNYRTQPHSRGYGGPYGKTKKREYGGWDVPSEQEQQRGVIHVLPEPIAGIVKVDETENEFRFRVVEPEGFSQFSATDFDGRLPDGVYVVRALGSDGVWVTQSVRFKKERFGFDEAQAWLKEHESLFT